MFRNLLRIVVICSGIAFMVAGAVDFSLEKTILTEGERAETAGCQYIYELKGIDFCLAEDLYGQKKTADYVTLASIFLFFGAGLIGTFSTRRPVKT